MKILILSLLLPFTTVVFANATMYKVVSGGPNTLVQFRSEATMETVEGKTQTVTGFVELDKNQAKSEIHVDLASLKTGIELRDQHMRDNHLETSKYPEAVFSLTKIELPADGLTEGLKTLVKVKGNLTLHGTTREISPETYLTLGVGESALRVESNFRVRLADYQIKLPQFLMMKLAEEQQIKVDFTAAGESAEVQLLSGEK